MLIDNAEDLDLVLPMYDLLYYSKDHENTTGSLWNYYREEPTIDDEINQYLKSNSFDYKSSIIGKLGNIKNDKKADSDDIKVIIPLKQLRNFRIILNIPLTNCEVFFTLSQSKDCVILSRVKIDAVAAIRLKATNVSDVLFKVDVSATNATFQITAKKLHVPVITLST